MNNSQPKNVITAKFDGLCPACDEPIEAGFDRIVYDEWEGTWVHEDCAKQPAEEEKRGQK